MRIAHISDLHFGSICWSPLQFLSKRWTGNLNFVFKRKKNFHYNRLIELIDLFKQQNVTHVFITGDLSVTSRRKEFKMARRYIDLLKNEGFAVFTIPGNHDQYTKRSYRKRSFYRFFDAKYDKGCSFDLKQDKVTYTPLQDGFWLMGIDTAVATSLISSEGYFSPQLEENFTKALEEIPKHEKVILMNHFPFFCNDSTKKQLLRGTLLKNILQKHPNVLLYLHGHTHRQTVADLRGSDLPIISDSGCTPHSKNGACHLFDFDDNKLKLDVYRYDGEWSKSESHSFKTT